ncbi:TRAF-type zinc finger domain-containing protein 1 [Rhinatrema bivittatum]|uniref:TRAF-type zinc finger domain-containing protein 1 n=1 Tax=Rhinatrema bivittatum TaxID=194408 RepID=UPI001129C31B|nr:TRAF-type zinc finger domain-containing protein 1 [Rhinatrema bivittatum]XP_029475522.1 TRAF-type zinc finger domain-containing protein 1 [Rhinatrema bivittatum]XP_029475523.1 TRAF-type zinc finger domain-containing protein 1 [Rhinatrema bivittatum]XP_029475524.1 TRAF-type zinc finger domain-containing protein 1 [Rhinatrema bivittatum]
MAAAAEKETQLCGNCKKDIPMANFTIHEIHCRRNIAVCQNCMEPVPKSEMEDHIESEHAQITCKCGMKFEKNHLEKHETLECHLRLVNCQYCELELAFNKVEDHEDYCGTRTEVCNGCGRNIMVKESKAHPQVCGKDGDKKNRDRPRPPYSYVNDDGTWFESRALLNFLPREDYGPHLPRIPRQLESRFYTNFGLDEAFEGSNRRRSQIMQVDQNQENEQEKLERNISFESPIHGVDNSSLDYLLALSLQNEHNPSRDVDAVEPDFWRTFYSKDLRPSRHHLRPAITDILSHDSSAPIIIPDEQKSNDIMLPCEFCEELFPEEDLILHQTGCNPDSVLASFSKRRFPPAQPQEQAKHFQSFLEQMSSPGFMSPGFASLSDEPPALEPEESIIIPCEFCGIQLEEEILFHHQDQCDLRPCTASPAERILPSQQWPPERDHVEKNESPEIHQRGIRNQGDISTHHLDEVQRRVNRASQSVQQSNLAVTRSMWPKPSDAAGDGDVLSLVKQDPTHRLIRGRNTTEPSAIQPTRSHYTERHAPVGPRASSLRHTSRNDLARNPRAQNAAVNRNRTTKTKRQTHGADDVKKEE